MADDRAKRIAERAYQLWEQEGRPEGRDREHWMEAERSLDGSGAVEPAQSLPNTGASSSRASQSPAGAETARQRDAPGG